MGPDSKVAGEDASNSKVPAFVREAVKNLKLHRQVDADFTKAEDLHRFLHFSKKSELLKSMGLLNNRVIDCPFCYTVPRLLLVPSLFTPGAAHVPNGNR